MDQSPKANSQQTRNRVPAGCFCLLRISNIPPVGGESTINLYICMLCVVVVVVVVFGEEREREREREGEREVNT